MLQIATFLVPDQQDKANEFLKTHKADQQFFNKDTVIFFYDDGVESPYEEIAGLQELLKGNKNARFQQEIALHVMSTQLADLKAEQSSLNYNKNKRRVEEVTNIISQIEKAISETNQALSMQDIKADFVNERIALIKRANQIDQ